MDYKLLFEHAAECMMVITADGDVLDANLKARKAIRRRREDLIAGGRDGVFDPKDPRIRSAFDELGRLGGFEGELRLLGRGGEPFDAEVAIAPFGEDGFFSVVFRDISGRELAESESEERFRITFDLAAVGIAHVDPNGEWVRVNKKLCEIVGYGRDELLGKTFQDITHPEDLEKDLEQVRRVLDGEIGTYSMEKRYLRKDGSVIWVCLTVSLVLGTSGEPSYFIAVVDDIDGRKRAERLRQSLSSREFEVLEMLVRGKPNKAIASSLGFGMSTAKTHVQRIITKLGVSSRSQAAARAVELGLVRTER